MRDIVQQGIPQVVAAVGRRWAEAQVSQRHERRACHLPVEGVDVAAEQAVHGVVVIFILVNVHAGVGMT